MGGGERDIEDRWVGALKFFRVRGGVLFFSESRFWEPHGFVQQSLAYALAREGIPVTWIDGAGWRPHRPAVIQQGLPLRVFQLPRLPGRRLGLVRELSTKVEARRLVEELAALGTNPVVWIQSGIDESLAEALPRIDVFSVFDDPLAHDPQGPLCRKARLVLCQNSTTVRTLRGRVPGKLELALPPVDLSRGVFEEEADLVLPARFASRRYGFLGSFFPESFDFALVESLLERLPEWGFVLMGRTDSRGEAWLRRLEARRNFLLLPWAPRSRLASAWRYLDVCLLPYRDFRGQDGAFATKAVEAFHFGKPVVATRVCKTEDLAPYAWLGTGADEIAGAVERAASADPASIAKAREHFETLTDPRAHLIRVAEILTRG